MERQIFEEPGTKKKVAGEYRVVWEIDVHADSPEEAAELALAIQRDPTSIATVFEVFSPTGERTRVNVDI